MRLRVEVTQEDIKKSKTFKWITPPWCNSPVYRAIVRQTGYRHVDVGLSKIMIRSNSRGSCFVYDFPPEARQWLHRYYHGKGDEGQMEPFTFDLELDIRGAKFLCLNQPCSRCGEYPRAYGQALCNVCLDYRESMQAYWR